MAESILLRNVMLAAPKLAGVAVRLFRNTVGVGWVGRSRRLRPGEVYRAQGGEVIITDPRPLHAGLFIGSGDAIGWTTIMVTEAMVGQRIAVFTSVETKVPVTGRMRTEQKTWHAAVQAAGGHSVIARSEADLEALARPPPR